jgi:hypothetical protein
MKCHLRWGNEDKTILVFELRPGWDWADFYAVHPTYVAMLDSVEHQVHLIYLPDAGADVLPANAIYHMRHMMMSMTHPREGQSVLVTESALLQSILKIMKRMYGVRKLIENHWIVPTLEDAYRLLADYEANRGKDRIAV